MDPPTDTGLTVIVAVDELAEVQGEDCTTARYIVVCVILVYESDVVVLVIGAHVLPPSVDCSHLTTLPVWPDKVRVPPFEPKHTAASPVTVPPTELAAMLMVAAEDAAGTQSPLCTTARYM